VIVIAIFYTEKLAVGSLLAGLLLVLGLFVAARVGIRQRWVFVLTGIVVWFFFLKSGVHATVAGVLVAMTVPHRVPVRGTDLDEEVEQLAGEVQAAHGEDESARARRQAAVQALHEVAHHAGSPLQALEHALARWVSFVIMPVFALANAGVEIALGSLGAALGGRIPLGIIAGLVVGKQVGVFGFSWLAVRLGWASLPQGVHWRNLHGAAILAGIGFTMSLFIANLAFGEGPSLEASKVGILAGSFVSVILGLAVLSASSRPARPEGS
jgi:NhaA family Na+:H+ antiporter